MLQARFMYENNLVGEWVDVKSETMLYVNPEFKHTIIGVQFRETNDLPQPIPKKKNWRYDPTRKVISNGR